MKKVMLGFAAGLFLAPTVALADSLTPASFSADLAVGESVTINKTLTVGKVAPTTSLVDVFFMADTTGSMGAALANVKAQAGLILSETAVLGDVAWGVGAYRDVGDSYVYRLEQAVTSNQANVQAAINTWVASGGGDGPEAQLYALEQMAEAPGTGWRAGSTRIAVWFGDYEGHDPRLGSTEASATAALLAAKIEVEAISVGANRLDFTGQATSITEATGGELYSGTAVADIVQTIKDAITTAISTYSTVALDLSEVPAGLAVEVAPVKYSGAYDRSIERTFEFDVKFTGVTPGAYAFDIYGTVDGGRIATESDRIKVGDAVPEPTTVLLFGAGLLGFAGLGRRRGNLK